MIKVYIEFVDKNMPNVNLNCQKIEEATSEGANLHRRYAGVRNPVIEYEDSVKDIYNSQWEQDGLAGILRTYGTKFPKICSESRRW